MSGNSTASRRIGGDGSGNAGSGLKLSKIMSSRKDLLLQGSEVRVLWVGRPFPWELGGSSSGEIEVQPLSHHPATGDLGNNTRYGEHPTERRVLAVLGTRSCSGSSADAW